ncbi:MAG: F0F1 ATP synthase subunit B' [Rhizobiales bacterium]|jgi:F-type H+-transporting ATPase subunit b|nr:F0F1 ATP synthase subunit B' [Hyphomicrobiales bacterium]
MATQAHTEQPGGKAPFPPFNQETFASQLIWLAIFFVALYVIIARVAIPRIGGIVEARRDRIEGDLAEANNLKEQSSSALAAYEKSLADARGRAQALANETRDKLNAGADTARRALEADLNAKLAKAEQTIAATKTAAMGNVRSIAVDTASAIVERLTGTAPAAGAVESAVANALKQ